MIRKLNLKSLAASVALATASLAAHAIGLDGVNGTAQWKLNGLTTESNTTVGSTESTWGVGAVTQIIATNGTWTAGSSDGTYLYYMIYGIADGNLIGLNKTGATGNATDYQIYNVGATGSGGADGKIHIDIYRTNTKITAIDQDFNANPNLRTSFNSYQLLSALGPAYLSLEMRAGKVLFDVGNIATSCPGPINPAPFDACETTHNFNESSALLYQETKSSTLPTTGKGDFFADVVGGTAAAKWDSSGICNKVDGSGNCLSYVDFDAAYTLYPNGSPGHGNQNCLSNGACFSGYINDPMGSNAIPEPGALALSALALLGAGVATRRRRKA